MKKLISIIVVLTVVFGAFTCVPVSAAPKEYEVWTQSPGVTSGITADDVRIYKALENNIIELLPLSKLGSNYYLAICSDKKNTGGYNGSSQTTKFYFYTLYTTNDGFVILSKATAGNEYFWDRGYSIADISSAVNSTYYSNNNSEVPYYIINPSGKYTHVYWDDYDEYFIITSSGKIYFMNEYAEYGAEGYPYIKDKILYRGQNMYMKTSTSAASYLTSDGAYASNSTPIFFRNGSLVYGGASLIATSQMTAANGYTMYKEGFTSNLSIPSYMPIAGSDNLFFNTSSVYTYDSSAGRNYYYLQVDVYKFNNGQMSKISSKTIPTTNTAVTNYTIQTINGLDKSYYTSKGYLVPAVVIGTQAIIATNGTVCNLALDTSIYQNYFYPCTYNGHFAIARSTTGGSAVYKKDTSNNTYYYWQIINEIAFNSNGTKIMTADKELRIQNTANSGQNGYFSSYSTWNSPNFATISSGNVKAWFGRTLTNVFPDGRYVTASWTSIGNGIFEIWYNIYNKNGTLRGTGPTGYSGYFGSVVDAPEVTVWTVNNSKFIVCIGGLSNTFLKEYYRVSVAVEDDAGEVSAGGNVGEKNIVPPSGTDTEVVQSKIDFGADDLPLGFNIKDNVIDSAKLDSSLRNQINTIRLNDIVILKKPEYQSGEQNTGITLDSYSSDNYSLGSTYVRMYTNGQTFSWSCDYPEKLTTGNYPKAIKIGDKTIYVTFRVVQPPTNEGSTTVVF